MADLIQLTSLNIASVQKSAAEAVILARRASDSVSTEEARGILKELVSKIRGVAEPLTSRSETLEYSRLSSDAWNDFQQSVIVDLTAIYSILEVVEATNRQLDSVTLSDLNQTKMAILKAINQLEVYQFLKDNPDFQDYKIIDFLRAVNESAQKPAAVIDLDVRMLELPAKARQVISSSRLGGKNSSAEARVFGGSRRFGFGEDFKPDNLLDANKKTFWAESIATNSPVQLTHELSWGTYTGFGVIAEVELTFSHVERVNNLKVLPFAEFPYNIIDIAYKDSAVTQQWHTLPGFSIRKGVSDWVEFDFPYLAIAKLRITIEQPNYIRNINLVPTSILRKNALWDNLHAGENRREISELDLSTRQENLVIIEPEQLNHLVALERLEGLTEKESFSGERHDRYRDFTKYIDSVNRLADEVDDLGDIIREPLDIPVTEGGDSVHKIITYEYLFGIRNIELTSILYEPYAFYESPAFVTNGTVIECQLETNEQQPVFVEEGQYFRRTSIEYEIEVAPGVRFPVVPVTDVYGSNYLVRDELVKLDAGIGYLRFTPQAGSLIVRRNGKKIPMTQASLSGRQLTLTEYSDSALYTATYLAAPSAVSVSIEDQLDSTALLQPEEFSKTDQDNKVTLDYYPYIIYEIVRDKTLWNKDSQSAKWEWNPEFYPVSDGTVSLTSESNIVTLAKDSVSSPDFSNLQYDPAYELKIYVQETGDVFDVAGYISTSQIQLSENYTGQPITASQFIIGRTVTHDGQVWGLNAQVYEPVRVYVDDVKAINITDYELREHPAFTQQGPLEKRYEFIHAGRNLYFNGPITGHKIKVVYSWLTQYLKLLATLRCNIPANTIFTPKIDGARIRVKTTEL